MKKTAIIIIALLVALAVSIGVYALTREDDGESSSTTTTNTTESTTDSSELPGDTEVVEGGTITYTNSGFTPETITVMSGATITVINESTESLDFSSNQHPIHTDNEVLNQSTLSPGERQSFVVDEKGTWGYHNHLDPDKTGTIIVE